MVQKLLLYLSTAFLLASCVVRSKLANVAEQLPPPPKNSTQTVASGRPNTDPSETLEDFFYDTVNAAPSSFIPVVGNWAIAVDDYNKLLKVDGSKTTKSESSTEIAEQVKAIYGDRAGEFIKNVQNSASFPMAIHKKVADFKEGEISVRFKVVGGKSDQSAGIVLAVQPNGNYLLFQVDVLNDTLKLFDYQQGKPRLIQNIKSIPAGYQEWHYLKIIAKDNQLQGFLDDKLYVQYNPKTPISGGVGLWSKGDSIIYFDNFKVQPPQSNNNAL